MPSLRLRIGNHGEVLICPPNLHTPAKASAYYFRLPANSGVRLIHEASGAVGEGREHRDNTRNRRSAFTKLVATEKFKTWHKIECARRMGQWALETPEQIMVRVDKMIEDGMRNGSIVLEEY